MYLHCIHISNKEAYDDSTGYVSTLSVLRPFIYSYRYEGFWIPLTYVWPEYRTCDTWEYILTLFLLLACWTDFRIWIACDVSASCMAVINSVVYLKAAVGNAEPTRLNGTSSRHVLASCFPYIFTGLNNPLIWSYVAVKNEVRRMKKTFRMHLLILTPIILCYLSSDIRK